MNPVYVASVGLLGPGLDGWAESRATLTGANRYQVHEVTAVAPDLLPANERRRTTALTRISLGVCQEALNGTDTTFATDGAAEFSTVFASSHGDAAVTDRICRALTMAERPISPTDFHNAVHNAPAGYWTIGTQSHTASTSISLADGTFAAGLLEALTLADLEALPVLLIACDLPLPHPLSTVETVEGPFAVALVLSSHRAGNRNGIQLRAAFRSDLREDQLVDPGLESLRRGNPAARSLPLLKSFATSASATQQTIILPYLADTRLEIRIAR